MREHFVHTISFTAACLCLIQKCYSLWYGLFVLSRWRGQSGSGWWSLKFPVPSALLLCGLNKTTFFAWKTYRLMLSGHFCCRGTTKLMIPLYPCIIHTRCSLESFHLKRFFKSFLSREVFLFFKSCCCRELDIKILLCRIFLVQKCTIQSTIVFLHILICPMQAVRKPSSPSVLCSPTIALTSEKQATSPAPSQAAIRRTTKPVVSKSIWEVTQVSWY